MAVERRVIGPPGSGKTQFARSQVAAWVERGEYEARDIVLTSFTRTAAAELRGRIDVPQDNVATLHSLARRIVGPDLPIAEVGALAKEWNESGVPPGWRIGGSPNVDDDGLAPMAEASSMLSEYSLARSKMLPDAHPAWERLRAFKERWEDFKRQTDSRDFCMDEETEVLTRRGWLSGWCVTDQDEVWSIDVVTGLAEWAPVKSVYRRVGKAAMVHRESQSHSSMTTPNHRWPVHKTHRPDIQWTTSEAMCSNDRIIGAARPGGLPTEPVVPDAYVELLAWWYTEGSFTRGGGGQIGQSHRVNPDKVAAIFNCLESLYGPLAVGTRGGKRWNLSRSDERGMTFFALSQGIVEDLNEYAPHKEPEMYFISLLTEPQLEKFVMTSIAADGHVRVGKGRRSDAMFFFQTSAKRMDAFVMACSLLGMGVSVKQRTFPGYGLAYSASVLGRDVVLPPGTMKTRGKVLNGRCETVEYNGLIWCPTVERHHNFLARRKGSIYYTGNTDLIELAWLEGGPQPNNLPVLMVDEAQDLVPLQWTLVRHWAMHDSLKEFILLGDPAQAIFSFAGARPDEMLSPLPDGQVRNLRTGHRLPRSVHAHAERYLSHHTGAMMEGREYTPVDKDGTVTRLPATWRQPDLVVSAAERAAAEGRTSLILATCAYMLEPTINLMRERGLAFHNPWRKSNGRWNPLGSRRAGSNRTVDRLAAYSEGRDPELWLPLLRAEVYITRGAKKALESDPVTWREWLRPEHAAAAEAGDTRWLLGHAMKDVQKPLEYAARIIARRGPQAVADDPLIAVGTGHSVKGGEASQVLVYPDLSAAGAQEVYASPAGADAAIRLGYVMATRAQDDLVVCAPAGREALEL